MAAWNKRYGQVALEDDHDNKAQDDPPGSRFFSLMRNKLSSVCEKEYTPLLVWLSFAIIFTICTVIVPLLVFQKFIHGSGNESSCSNESKNYTVPDIYSSLNRDADPCDNFYEFACGGWEKNNPIPEGKDEWTTFRKQEKVINEMTLELLQDEYEDTQNPAFRQAKLLYRKCMELNDLDAIEETYLLDFVKDTLGFYGGWPIISGSAQWNPDNFNWMKSAVGLKRRFYRPVILDINSYRDVESGFGKNTLFVNITKPASDLYDLRNFNVFWPWNSYIVDLSKQLMSKKDKLEINETSLHEQAARIKQVHADLVVLNRLNESTVVEFRRGYGFIENFGFTTLINLQEMLDKFEVSGSSINLLEMLNLLYETSGVEISKDTMVYINDINHLLNVQAYINSLDKIDLANYLHFRMAHSMIALTTKQLRELHLEGLFGLKRNITNMSEADCIDFVRKRLRFVLEPKLVEKEYGSEACFKKSRDEVVRMYEQYKKVFRDAKYASGALEEDPDTNICVAFPDWIFDNNRLQMEYAGLNLSRPTFLEQVMAVNEWHTVKRQRVPILPLGNNDCDWSKMEIGLALTSPARHQIYLNWKMLMPPYFSVGHQNRAHNYGAMGTSFAHEFSHILDRNALLNFKLNSNKTREEECLLNQYQNISLNLSTGFKNYWNVDRTFREDLADNVGLQLAYMAFKADNMPNEENNVKSVRQKLPGDFTDDQKFFIGFTQQFCNVYTKKGMEFMLKHDEHSPSKFRVLGTLQNSNDFSKAWNCPVGSNMNPDPMEQEKCIFVSDQAP